MALRWYLLIENGARINDGNGNGHGHGSDVNEFYEACRISLPALK